MNEATFTHKTPHLKKSQHQLDPNLQLKHLVHHSVVQYVDRDADGDVDVYDNPKKKTPDESPQSAPVGAEVSSKKLLAKQKGELKHTRRGMAYEETGEVRYCPACKKSEIREECKYGAKYWDMFSQAINLTEPLTANQLKYNPNRPHPANEEKDHEYSMARSELSTIISAVSRLKKKMKGEGNIEAWVQSKITKAADYIDTAADYIDSKESKVNEDVTIEDANCNTFVRIIDIIKADRLVKEGKKMKGEDPCWKGYEMIGKKKKGGKEVPNCVPKEQKSFSSFMIEAKKSEMKCNSPKSEPVGDSLTGKSHVVKACEGGKEKLIRFGQRGVKGSPKKEGESKAYASRRHRFQTRHAKNIAKGKMSAAYWANKVKW